MGITGFNIDQFKAVFEGGARAYLFTWVPTLLEIGWNSRYLVRSASMPESTVTERTAYWQGMKYTVGGSREFADWMITVYCDEGSSIRSAFELWMHQIHMVIPEEQWYGSPTTFNPFRGNYGYLRDQGLLMLDGEGYPTTGVYLANSWPKNISAISLDYSTQEIASFEVTLSYMYHVIVPMSLDAIPIPITGPGFLPR